MNVTKDSIADKSFREILERAESLQRFVVESVSMGKPMHEVERGVLDQVLIMGRHAIDATLRLQGEGDLGATHTTADGRELRRSAGTERRRLRTVFGEHEFQQYQYSAGAGRAIELRPIDARLGLSPRIGSYLFEEFTQLFCVETAFAQSARNFTTVFRQEVPVDTLEAIARRMGAAAETYADTMPTPLAAHEGELLVVTMDAKGVPLIQEHPVPVKAFETRRLRPGNRRMATLAGAYSVDRHVRDPEQIVAALFRDPPAAESSCRPEPRGKHLTVHFPEVYQDGESQVASTGAIEACCWLMSEVNCRRQSQQPLLLLIDGDHRLWETAAEHLPDDRVEILDIVHVSAYVWEAAGVIEGACRHLVKDRMERSGMRWTLIGAKTMLNLRAVIASGHWDDFQSTRRGQEVQHFHPHRAALQDYQGSSGFLVGTHHQDTGCGCRRRIFQAWRRCPSVH